MKLFYFPVAPNPTRVRLYLEERRGAGCPVEVELVLVNLPKGEHRSAENLERNPTGRLPILELDDGTFLTESLPIAEYFEDACPGSSLFGTDVVSRARIRELERIADLGVLIPIARIVHATRSPLGKDPNPAVADYYSATLPESLQRLDAELAHNEFVAGDSPSMADCTLAAALQFGRFREIDVLDPFANLRRWDAAFRERPSAQEVLTL
jgi:glutathione S-transferase